MSGLVRYRLTCRFALVAAALGLFVGPTENVVRGQTTSDKAKLDPQRLFREQVAPFLKTHCLDCHGPDVQEAEIGFHDYQDVAKVTADVKTWTRVIQMIETGVMPPDDAPQPKPAERKRIVADLEKILFNVDCDGPPDPGRVTIRRLNRAEYNNTVRDLLGVTFRPADDFPSDDVGSGFDNIGDVLTLPPLLMEKYLAAAERIAEQTIVADTKAFVKSQRLDRRQLQSDGQVDYDNDRRRWVIASTGSVGGQFNFPRDGQYTLRVEARATRAGDEPAQLELRLGDAKAKVFDVNAIGMRGSYEVATTAKAGMHLVSAHFLNDYYDPEAEDPDRRDRNLIIEGFEVDGPLDLRLEDYPETHRKLLAVRPDDTTPVLEAARRNLSPLVGRAFRRPASADEVAGYSRLVDAAVQEGDSFEQAMQVAVTAVLVSPQFLFRVEHDPPPAKGGPAVRELDDYELAARLSYFLWSSMPDDELFAAAAAGKLRDAGQREQQIRRMLSDPRSDALVQNFASQWLNLRLLDGVTPDPRSYPDFNAALKADMRRETELFVQAIIREDRSLLDFLDGRFTFVNDRLARHYGLEGEFGDEFRRVDFAADRRAGVVTQASILTLTSNPARTSPVKRGKWILENLLGSPPPDPPPDVPELEATQQARPGLSLRQQLEIHRQNAVCASCHKTMDQLGFGLENFDAIGRWRDKDGKLAIDASGELPGGHKFAGPGQLASVLKARREEFARCLAERMLTFALGRGLESYDRCAVDTIVEGVEKKDYRFSALVVEIASSAPFCKRRGPELPAGGITK
jgi:PAS domain-containing protein